MQGAGSIQKEIAIGIVPSAPSQRLVCRPFPAFLQPFSDHSGDFFGHFFLGRERWPVSPVGSRATQKEERTT
jgi:hypothetical protein